MLAAAAIFTAGFATLAQAQTAVTSCGQVLEGDGVLVGDLDCSAAPAMAHVTFNKGATFDLAGFTISGEVVSFATRLDVIGPGTITGPGYGIRSEGSDVHGSQVTVRNVTVAGNASGGIYAEPEPGDRASIRVYDSTIDGNNGRGIDIETEGTCGGVPCDPVAKIRIENTSVSGNTNAGIRGMLVDVRDSSVDNNGQDGIFGALYHAKQKISIRSSSVDGNDDNGVFLQGGAGGKLLVKDSSLSGNDVGVVGTNSGRLRMKFKNTNLDGNRVGIYTSEGDPAERKKLSLGDSTVLGSVLRGVEQHGDEVQVRIKGSTITGSGSSPDCGVTEVCADIEAEIEPRLRTTVCETSHVAGSGIPGGTWGLCSLD